MVLNTVRGFYNGEYESQLSGFVKPTDDSFPLLYVYLDDAELMENTRSRTMKKGAASILARWPDHLTVTSMMGVISLLLVFGCFLFIVFLVMIRTPENHITGPFYKCDKNEDKTPFVRLKTLENLVHGENATYFVEKSLGKVDENRSATVVEMYLRKNTSMPVYYIHVVPTNQKLKSNPEIWRKLEKEYVNFKSFFFTANSFFNGTILQSLSKRNAPFLDFLVKITLSWNFSGIILDSNWLTLTNYNRRVLTSDDKDMIIGVCKDKLGLIDSRKFCHTFIFEIMKILLAHEDDLQLSELGIINTALNNYCVGKEDCKGVKVVSSPVTCTPETRKENCVFMDLEQVTDNSTLTLKESASFST